VLYKNIFTVLWSYLPGRCQYTGHGKISAQTVQQLPIITWEVIGNFILTLVEISFLTHFSSFFVAKFDIDNFCHNNVISFLDWLRPTLSRPNYTAIR